MAVYKSITFDNRKKIAALYAKGMSISDISDEVGVALRTLYVELKRGATGKLDHNQRPAYDPVLAQRTYQENIRRRGSGPKMCIRDRYYPERVRHDSCGPGDDAFCKRGKCGGDQKDPDREVCYQHLILL